MSALSPHSCGTTTWVGYWGIWHKIELLHMLHDTQSSKREGKPVLDRDELVCDSSQPSLVKSLALDIEVLS